MAENIVFIVGLVLALCYLAGILSAIHAVQEGHAAEGTVAWLLGLLLIPWLAVPAYWTFALHHRKELFSGRPRWDRSAGVDMNPLSSEVEEAPPVDEQLQRLESLTPFRWRGDGDARLLINAEEKYAALFEAIEAARREILAEYFLVRPEGIGREFIDRLKSAAGRGVRVHLLYDALVSSEFDRRAVQHDLREAGIEAHPFHTPARGHFTRWHFNFRNHRKICVVDGEIGFTGGINIGDEYLGRVARFGPWRDTHLRLTGSAVCDLMAIYRHDWQLALNKELPEPVRPEATAQGSARALVIPMGPETERDFSTHWILELLRLARHRVWITTPFLVPNEAISAALEHAALRGLEVKILTTGVRYYRMSFAANYFYAEKLRRAGVHVYRIKRGFTHQKTILVDDLIAGVGTMNLDNRSLRLNFELMVGLTDHNSVAEIHRMLEKDFTESIDTEGEWRALSRRGRLAACFSRLFAPLL